MKRGRFAVNRGISGENAGTTFRLSVERIHRSVVQHEPMGPSFRNSIAAFLCAALFLQVGSACVCAGGVAGEAASLAESPREHDDSARHPGHDHSSSPVERADHHENDACHHESQEAPDAECGGSSICCCAPTAPALVESSFEQPVSRDTFIVLPVAIEFTVPSQSETDTGCFEHDSGPPPEPHVAQRHTRAPPAA